MTLTQSLTPTLTTADVRRRSERGWPELGPCARRRRNPAWVKGCRFRRMLLGSPTAFLGIYNR